MNYRDGRYAVVVKDNTGHEEVVHRSDNKHKALEVVKVYRDEGFVVVLVDEDEL